MSNILLTKKNSVVKLKIKTIEHRKKKKKKHLCGNVALTKNLNSQTFDLIWVPNIKHIDCNTKHISKIF